VINDTKKQQQENSKQLHTQVSFGNSDSQLASGSLATMALGQSLGMKIPKDGPVESTVENREFGRELTNGNAGKQIAMNCTSLQSSAQGKNKNMQNQAPEPKAGQAKLVSPQNSTLSSRKLSCIPSKSTPCSFPLSFCTQHHQVEATSRNEKSSLNSTQSNGFSGAFGPHKQNSSFQQNQQPLKRCKSSAQNPVASKGKDIATVTETTQNKKKVLNKMKSGIA
jgi:hypothetical protein